jgi:hypothetical protein
MEQRLVLLTPEASVRFGVLKLREPYLQNLSHCHPAVAVFVDEQELLRIGQAGRNHHFPAIFQLIDQRRGNEVRSRCHDHFIERSVLGPAMIAIRNSELTDSLLCLLPQLFDDLDAVHLPSQLCEDCGLIAKTGADLEDNVGGADIK